MDLNALVAVMLPAWCIIFVSKSPKNVWLMFFADDFFACPGQHAVDRQKTYPPPGQGRSPSDRGFFAFLAADRAQSGLGSA